MRIRVKEGEEEPIVILVSCTPRIRKSVDHLGAIKLLARVEMVWNFLSWMDHRKADRQAAKEIDWH